MGINNLNSQLSPGKALNYKAKAAMEVHFITAGSTFSPLWIGFLLKLNSLNLCCLCSFNDGLSSAP
jgi:hypothetical protein|nr:hypothetical protein Q903MT_gene1862 [Picea sitchensis]